MEDPTRLSNSMCYLINSLVTKKTNGIASKCGSKAREGKSRCVIFQPPISFRFRFLAFGSFFLARRMSRVSEFTSFHKFAHKASVFFHVSMFLADLTFEKSTVDQKYADSLLALAGKWNLQERDDAMIQLFYVLRGIVCEMSENRQDFATSVREVFFFSFFVFRFHFLCFSLFFDPLPQRLSLNQ